MVTVAIDSERALRNVKLVAMAVAVAVRGVLVVHGCNAFLLWKEGFLWRGSASVAHQILRYSETYLHSPSSTRAEASWGVEARGWPPLTRA